MNLIGDLYEAAMLPEYWPVALQNLTQHIGVAGSTLITIDEAKPRWTASSAFMDKMRLYLEAGWHGRNEPMERLLKLNSAGFVRDIDLFTVEEVNELPIVRDLKRPGGVGWSAAMATPMPAGEMLLFSIEQYWDRGPLDNDTMLILEELRPHMSRAALLAAKLRHERAEAAVESLDLAAVPAALVTHHGKVLAANSRFQAFKRELPIGAHNRLQVSSPRAGDLLRTALARLALDLNNNTPLSIAVPAPETGTPVVVHILPTKGRARDLFGAMTALIIVTSVQARTAPSASLLKALFDLTPSEARVCEALLSGLQKSELQAQLSISSETERSHMKSIFRKTGLARRIDLVRFLGGLSPT